MNDRGLNTQFMGPHAQVYVGGADHGIATCEEDYIFGQGTLQPFGLLFHILAVQYGYFPAIEGFHFPDGGTHKGRGIEFGIYTICVADGFQALDRYVFFVIEADADECKHKGNFGAGQDKDFWE